MYLLTTKRKLGVSFFLFGLINNVLYVIILSAALDLVPPSTPKGIIAFCNIAPALVAKVGWPYLLHGQIRYTRRLIGCCVLSSMGMLVVAFFDSLYMRLLGISLASFSSGLGELTFLQLSTTYIASIAGTAVGYFASGTGAAGLVGAFLWWELRGFGVRVGVGLSSLMPLIIPLTYYALLPSALTFRSEEDSDSPINPHYIHLPVDDNASFITKTGTALSFKDKMRLVRPLLLKYMLPLFAVYTFEYTINQGISPTLVYPIPKNYPILKNLIHSIRDYYPLWQLIYQLFVFLSRSCLILGLPPLPEFLLPLPAVVQGLILLTLAFESAVGFTSEDGIAIVLDILLISLEGICGGLAYVNVFYRLAQDPPGLDSETVDDERRAQEKEFMIGSIGFADSSGILFAALVAIPTEIELCKAQVARHKYLCKAL